MLTLIGNIQFHSSSSTSLTVGEAKKEQEEVGEGDKSRPPEEFTPFTVEGTTMAGGNLRMRIMIILRDSKRDVKRNSLGCCWQENFDNKVEFGLLLEVDICRV